MQHVDIKQSLNETSLLQLILSIKNLKLSSIDLYENKDRKKVLIYRQSDRHQICIRPDHSLFIYFCLFVYLFSVCWVHKTAMVGSDRKTNAPMNKNDPVLPEKK